MKIISRQDLIDRLQAVDLTNEEAGPILFAAGMSLIQISCAMSRETLLESIDFYKQLVNSELSLIPLRQEWDQMRQWS